MSHQLDLEGVAEKLVILQHFAHGSKEYCRARLIGSEQDVGHAARDEYWVWAKGLVSSYMLECSIRIRVLLDTVSDKPEAKEIASIDAAVLSRINIGEITKGIFDLSIRESCNKIIHAKKVAPIWATAIDNNLEFEYWSGDFSLSGAKGNNDWQLTLHVASWAKAVDEFLSSLDSEMVYDVGQDWY